MNVTPPGSSSDASARDFSSSSPDAAGLLRYCMQRTPASARLSAICISDEGSNAASNITYSLGRTRRISGLFSIAEKALDEMRIELPSHKIRIGKNLSMQRYRGFDAFDDKHLERPLHAS